MALLVQPDTSITAHPRVFPGRLERPRPRGVQKSRCKAQLAQNELFQAEKNPIVESSFITRFFALPSELRNEVYRHLLIQPCKFDMRHKDSCRYQDRISIVRPGPGVFKEGACARCATWGYKEPQVQISVSPFRSKWGKPHTNAYLCDNCYWDVAGRDYGDPCMKSLCCLCTRRTDLDVLLINKRFYNEAAPIFWSESRFAFEYPNLLSGFLRAISPQVRSWVRQISFMPSHNRLVHDDTTIPQRMLWGGPTDGDLVDPWGWGDIKSCWQLLRQCEGLTWLEVDVYCLQRLEWALLIRLIHVRRSVVFSRRPGADEIDDKRINTDSKIWLSIGGRQPVHTLTTELMIESMTNPRNMKAKVLKRHYAETKLHEIYGGDIYPGVDYDSDDW